MSAVAVIGFGAYAWAADLNTINQTESYADPANAAKFIVTPTDCAAAPDSTDNVLACNALGNLAVQAVQGLGPMTYFQSNASLGSTNAFVPNSNIWNLPGSAGGGFAPLFSMNDRQLFGSRSEMIGTFTREELFFLGLLPGGGFARQAQTAPGDPIILDMVKYMLTQPENATTISFPPYTFNFSDLPTYQKLTGLTSGKYTTIQNNCLLHYPLAICNALGPDTWAVLYLADLGVVDPAVLNVFPGDCGAGDATCAQRTEWVDQTVVGYVTSLDKNTNAQELTQNFRSQISFDTTPLTIDSTNLALIDQRLEQSVELGMAQFEAQRQTLQQAFHSRSWNDVPSPDFRQFAQLVSQDVEGYLFSCLNCDTPELIASGASHAFEPSLTTDQITFIPYWSNWHSVPTITHAP